MIEIEADFSTTVRGGMIRAYRSDAPANLAVGDVVRAVDHDEELSYAGTVVDVDGPFIYLLMHWRNRREVVTVPGGSWYSIGPQSGVTIGTGHAHEDQTARYRYPVAV